MKLPPASFLKCMSPADRKSLGKAGQTPAETFYKAEIKNERDLQRLIVNLLRLRGIEANVSRTDKRKTDRIGWPDITFAVVNNQPPAYYHRDHEWELYQIIPCAWEVKFGSGALSPEQQDMLLKLATPPNAWRVKVIRSVDEALAELKELGQ